jgi:cytochrome c-type biogenesis protein CcmH
VLRCLGLLLLALQVFAFVAVVRADSTDDAVRRIGLQLQCPVCEGQTVADSNSGLAQDMRRVIRTKVESGESDQQILNFFVGSYGDGVLTEPPKRGVGLGVWLGAGAGIVAGAVVLLLLLMRWRTQTPISTAPSAALDADVAEEFGRFRQELGR